MRLIDADLLEKEIYKWMPKDQETWMEGDIPPIENLVVSIMMTIQEQPTVDAVPVRHGKWIKLDMHAHLADHKCTACGQECYVPTCMGEPMYIYCPNCGARMDEE